MADYHTKQAALARLAEALKAQGWTLYGYQPNESNAMIDYYSPASWSGYAEHKAYPGLKVVASSFAPRYCTFEHPPSNESPKGAMWHIEQNGKLIASGKGFNTCGDYKNGAKAACELAAEITNICRQRTTATAAKAEAQSPRGIAASTATPVAITEDGNWLWVKFAQKPDELVRVQLKQLGGSFSKRRQAWYFTSPQYLDQLRALFPTTTLQ